MRKFEHITAILLGVAFIIFGLNFFFSFFSVGGTPPAADSYAAKFFGSVGPSGFMTYVKTFEIIGGLAMVIPHARNLGLILLGPIVVNILAVNIFIKGDGAVFAVPTMAITVLLICVVVARSKNLCGFLFSK